MDASSEVKRVVTAVSEADRDLVVSVKVERVYGKARITPRYESVSATNIIVCPTKSLERPINDEALVGTPLPERFWHRLGAFVPLLLRDPKIPSVEIKQTDDGGWIVEACVMDSRRRRLRRGEGDTPVEAFANLVADIYG